MTFKGFDYEVSNTILFPTEPSFSYNKKHEDVSMLSNEVKQISKAIYQFNICYILQWIVFLQQKFSNKNLKLYLAELLNFHFPKLNYEHFLDP